MFTSKRRMFYSLMLFTVIFICIAIRMAWMQLHRQDAGAVSKKSIAQLSVLQRERGIVLDSGRGHFYDRNGIPLTGKQVPMLVMFPIDPASRGLAVHQQQLAAILGLPYSELDLYWKQLKAPTVWTVKGTKQPYRLSSTQIQRIEQLSLNGVRILPMQTRYDATNAAKQWLGFIAEQPELLLAQRASGTERSTTSLNTPIGAAGLERTFDPFLRGIGPTIATYFVDGARRPLYGLDTRVSRPNNPFYPLRIITTVDLSIQSKLEAYADQAGLTKGAIVVLDAASGDVVAMVSKPSFDPNHVDLKEGSWGNRALKALVPGSIYKVVTAAAALETIPGIERATFECHGEYGKYGFSCWKKDGHGLISLEEGFAKSCNIVFATIGEHMKAETLTRYASMLGLSRTVGWQSERWMDIAHFNQLDGEEAGRVFAAKQIDGGVMVQSAVGQRDVLVSPLQAANLVVTLLNNGEVHAPRLVKEIRYANGQLLTSVPKHLSPSPYGSIRPDTTHHLMHWMEEVVTDGTGTALKRSKWKLAGKSGTAQVKKHGHTTNNHWFIGYGPVTSPRYAVAIVSENKPTIGSNQATSLFKGVMDLLADHDSDSAPSNSSLGSRIQDLR
ncbi:peptidoglycan D,D-transpeptidase FtsI family protein [Paenibacillus guangzhouensis]|uniref:peptidoglycan D,D-transpeptidase FtsI family protein n=1 Tax=Paenibacillus guangzhouensis TaxID=1473112 RepID=UPI0012668BF3|nr:penicillin-binding transpeptidase domain-containing protein [Paenibacillus guangzhouensis]